MTASRATADTYESPDKLARLAHAMHAADPAGDIFALCVDTSHIWAAGVDISSARAADEWLAALDAETRRRFRLLHFNGNVNARATGRDQHNRPFHTGDAIWGAYHAEASRAESGAASFMRYAQRHASR